MRSAPSYFVWIPAIAAASAALSIMISAASSTQVGARQAATVSPQGPSDPQETSANMVRGETLFQVCASCHEVGENARPKIGPVLTGIVGRRIAGSLNYDYSAAMATAGGKSERWTEAKLDAYLKSPGAVVPENKMAFAGLKNADDRRDVIAYLSSLTLLPERNPIERIVSPIEPEGDATTAPR